MCYHKSNGGHSTLSLLLSKRISLTCLGFLTEYVSGVSDTLFIALIFTPLDAEIGVGDRIVTSGVSGVFPAGLPVGQVVSVSKNEIRVKPFFSKDKIEYIKIVKYGIPGLLKEQEGDGDE